VFDKVHNNLTHTIGAGIVAGKPPNLVGHRHNSAVGAKCLRDDIIPNLNGNVKHTHNSPAETGSMPGGQRDSRAVSVNKLVLGATNDHVTPLDCRQLDIKPRRGGLELDTKNLLTSKLDNILQELVHIKCLRSDRAAREGEHNCVLTRHLRPELT
jgi:hypothetical protein